MQQCVQPFCFSRRRKRRQDKRQRQLDKLARMRARKAQLKQERIAAGLLEPEPKMSRWYPFEFAVRDKRTGVIGWHDLVSVRQATLALGLIVKYCS
jgi:hypothetical protein